MRFSLVVRLALFATLAASLWSAEAPAPSPAPDPFEGTWVGTVSGPDQSTAIGFTFKHGKKNPALFASLTMPAMFVSGMNLGPAQIRERSYTLPDLGINLTLDGDVLSGTFANPLLRVTLHRGEPLAPLPPVVPPPAPPALWTASLGAETWTSPVAADGVLYVGCVDGRFHAVKVADGSPAWIWTGVHAIYGTAQVTGPLVCFVDDAGDLVALERATGQLAWRTALYDEKIAGKPAPKNPTFNRRVPVPSVADGRLYLGSADHGVYAVEAANGSIVWRHDVGAAVFASITLDGPHLIVGVYDGSVIVLDRASGQEQRRTKVGGPVASAPVVAGDTVIVGCRDYLLYGLSRSDLSVLWRDTYWFSWVESVPQFVGGVAYVGGSDFRRISALDPATGRSRWVTDVGGLTWGTPAVTARSVYAGSSAQNPAAIRHEGGITALDRQTGSVKWRLPIPMPAGAERAGVLGSLLVVDGRVIGAGFDGTLYALPAD